MKRWSTEEDQFLVEELKAGSTHESIGYSLNRTKSSIMHRVQRLGLSKKNPSWIHLTNDDMLELVRKYKTAEEFDNNPEIPSYKTIVRRFEVNTWNEVIALAGLCKSKGTRYDHTKETTFYILEFVDTDETVFKKYGVTQRPLTTRYKGKPFKIIHQEIGSLQNALDKEEAMDQEVTKYRPLSRDFYAEGHGGYTECFI